MGKVIVILAESPEQLQCMINRLEMYCELWDFRINLDKSKVMIFGTGKRAARERWEMNGQALEIVTEYKYLGVVFTRKLSMHSHLQERQKKAKYSINITWSNLLKNRDVSIETKLKMFDACSRSVMCYGAQVWGYREWEEVEKLQRYFLKKTVGSTGEHPKLYASVGNGFRKKFYLYNEIAHEFRSKMPEFARWAYD